MNINGLIKEFGSDCQIKTDDGFSSPLFRAFIQPLRYKNKMYLEGSFTNIGTDDEGYYLYIGPNDKNLCALETGAYIEAFSEKFRIIRAEQVYFGNEVLYYWAIVKTVYEQEDE